MRRLENGTWRNEGATYFSLRCGCEVQAFCCLLSCQGRDPAKCLRHYMLGFWHVYDVPDPICNFHDRDPYNTYAWSLRPTKVEQKELRVLLRAMGVRATMKLDPDEEYQMGRENDGTYSLMNVSPMLPDGYLKDKENAGKELLPAKAI